MRWLPNTSPTTSYFKQHHLILQWLSHLNSPHNIILMKKHINHKHKVIIAKYVLHLKLSMMLMILDLKKVFETQNNYVSFHSWFFFNLATTQECISNIDVIHWKTIVVPYKGIWSFVHNGVSLPTMFCHAPTSIKFVSLLENNLSKNTILLCLLIGWIIIFYLLWHNVIQLLSASWLMDVSNWIWHLHVSCELFELRF
jgi:hypothetical protein